MYFRDSDPILGCFQFFSNFMGCGGWAGRQFYTRKERIERLEQIKRRLQDELAGIDELIEELRSGGPKQA